MIDKPASNVEVVIAVVFRDDGRVLMIRRKKAEGPLLWAFPGGKVKRAESEAAASEREVHEESGVDCTAVRKIGQWVHPDSQKVISYWWCKHDGGIARLTEPDKIDRIEWVTIGDVSKRITSKLFPKLKEELWRHAHAKSSYPTAERGHTLKHAYEG
jgi:8-oxo-dGTP diphosphatase